MLFQVPEEDNSNNSSTKNVNSLLQASNISNSNAVDNATENANNSLWPLGVNHANNSGNC